MKNNALGFIVYFVATVLLSEKVRVNLLAIKKNSDRCHYYNGKWKKTDLAIVAQPLYWVQPQGC